MPRHGTCPIPKSRAEFIAFVRRVEAHVYRNCADMLRQMNPRQTAEEHAERFACYAADREQAAAWVEELAAGRAADRDDCITAEYRSIMRLVAAKRD